MYEQLNLKAWPFQVIPDSEFATIWAGRSETKKQLERLIQKMQMVPKSSLHLLWANFGMGKTHTLLHLQHLCQPPKGKLVPAYVVMPNDPKSFVDVYRAIVSALPLQVLGDQLIKVSSGWGESMTTHPMFAKSPGIVNAILALRKGDIETSTAARQWLTGQPGLTTHDLRAVGVSYRIKTPEDAVNALTVLTRIITFKPNDSNKLVVMFDEYQRIGELKPNIRQEINTGMKSYFDAHPKGLEIVLSFSFGRRENVEYLLSGELKSRANPQSISLDVLSRSEATEFIQNLLAQFRIRPDHRLAYPFSLGALQILVEHIAQTKTLTPRRLMQYSNHVLLESQMSRDPQDGSEISSQEMKKLLADSELGEIDTDNQT